MLRSLTGLMTLLFVGAGCGSNWELSDLDGDGLTPAQGDCWDLPEGPTVDVGGVSMTLSGAEIGPDMPDAWYDGIDANCDGTDDFDADRDGYVPLEYEGVATFNVEGSGALPGGDCWDSPVDTPDDMVALNGLPQLAAAEVHPGVADLHYDGIDADCAGEDADANGAADDFDADADGYESSYHVGRDGSVGDDCIDCVEGELEGCLSDSNPAGLAPDQVNPGVSEGYDELVDGPCLDGEGCDTCYDGTDADCAGEDADSNGTVDEQDCDRDGYEITVDCDDENELRIPDPTQDEIPYDGLDNNCDLTDGDGDADGDGYWAWNYAELVAANTTEPPRDIPEGYDGDCWDDLATPEGNASPLNGMPALSPEDVNPAATEIHYDGIDQDCAGEDANADGAEDDFDWDGDGFTTSAAPDSSSTVGLDCNDCEELSCGGDSSCAEYVVCQYEPANDVGLAAGGINPEALETWYDGTDQDCKGENANGDATIDDYDADGDGYYSDVEWMGGDDCDDSMSNVNLGVNEDCSTTYDDDCDTDTNDIDSDACITWYQDSDGDGHGNPGEYQCTCEERDDYNTLTTDDCDDDSAVTYTGATELCDGDDNACDGTLDADEIDGDSDGYVDCTLDVAAAAWVDATITGGDDCDDTYASTNPGASEICDGDDNDCDSSLPTNETDDDGDGYVECDPDVSIAAWVDATITGGNDCDDTYADTWPGASEICDGDDNDCGGVLPTNETDDDGDGYVECTLAVSVGSWYGDTISGGDDCDDGENTIYDGAAELCDGQINDCATSSLPTNETDDDGDGAVECTFDAGGWNGTGLVTAGDDCDDTDSTVYIGATELCDGQINNCSTSSLPGDEVDNDTDTYVECIIDAGGWDGTTSVVGGEDCDDAVAAANPGETEVCDDIDNNCDDLIDDDDPSLDKATGTAFYTDDDNDDYGDDAAVAAYYCSEPALYSSVQGDCDDTDPAINPDAVEVCDSVDNDCNSDIDDADSGLDTSTADPYYADGDTDGYGDEGASIEKFCVQPSGYSSSNDDCDDGNSSVNPGATEVCEDGLDNDCDAATTCALPDSLADASGSLIGDTGAGLGWSVALFDNDGDGTSDLFIGAPYTDSSLGAVYLIAGPTSASKATTAGGSFTADDRDSSGVDELLLGSSTAGLFGYSIAGLGDQDADGYEELLVGAPGTTGSETSQGAVYLFHGPVTSLFDTDADLVMGLASPVGTDLLGYTTWGHLDYNNDNIEDILIGSPENYSGIGGSAQNQTGNVYLIYGGTTAASLSVDIDADLIIAGYQNKDMGGASVSGTDYNGDGYDDLLIGGPYAEATAADNKGLAWLLFGPDTFASGLVDLGSDGTYLSNTNASAFMGWSVAGGFDIDGDGTEDAAIGARGWTSGSPVASSCGMVFVSLGDGAFSTATNEIDLDSADILIRGSSQGDQAGSAISAGDVNGDGNIDLLIGAWRDDDGTTNAGTVGVFYGPLSTGSYSFADANVIMAGVTATDSVGYGSHPLDASGDIDGDGTDDVLVGGTGYDGSAAGDGTAWFSFGYTD